MPGPRSLKVTVAALAFLAALPAWSDPYTEVMIEGHRCVVDAPGDLPDGAPVVLILHGLGGNGDEMTDLCGRLSLPPCLFVMPDGPFPVPNLPSADHGWYDRITHSRSDIERSRDYLFQVMDYFSRNYPDPPLPGHPRAPRPVIVTGFSQGAVMSLEAGLNYKGRVLAVVCMSGYMGEPEKTLSRPAAPRTLPILMTHGTMDVVVQEDSTQDTLRALQKAGYRPVLREYPAGHTLTGDMVEDISRFLRQVMAHAVPR
jgi:phospholipase/carboxylesterase